MHDVGVHQPLIPMAEGTGQDTDAFEAQLFPESHGGHVGTDHHVELNRMKPVGTGADEGVAAEGEADSTAAKARRNHVAHVCNVSPTPLTVGLERVGAGDCPVDLSHEGNRSLPQPVVEHLVNLLEDEFRAALDNIARHFNQGPAILPSIRTDLNSSVGHQLVTHSGSGEIVAGSAGRPASIPVPGLTRRYAATHNQTTGVARGRPEASGGMLVGPMLHRFTILCLCIGALTVIGCGAQDEGSGGDGGKAPANVVVLLADDLAPGILGFDGNPDIRTPHLDRLADEGTCFLRAYVPLAQCGPSRAAMLTGRYPHRLGVLTNDGARLPARQPTIARAFRGAGYRCGFVGKWGLGPAQAPQAGFRAYWRAMARTDRYQDPRLWVDGENLKQSGWLPDVLTDMGIEFIEGRGDEPFFLWISYKTPHGPLTTPPAADLSYTSAELSAPTSASDDLSGKPRAQREGYAHQEYLRRGMRAVHKERAVYYAMVSALDRSIGRLASYLDESGLSENTLLIFTSDNGWFLGEHQMATKGPSLYEELVRAPMLLRWPGRVPSNQRNEALVSTLDLFPTLLALLGQLDGEADGHDLWPLIEGRVESVRDVLFLEYWKKKPDDAPVPMLGLVTHSSKYTRYLDSQEEEHYDLESDPDELNNLVSSAAHLAELTRLRDLLDAHAQTIEKPFW